jgi:hypothetical protein
MATTLPTHVRLSTPILTHTSHPFRYMPSSTFTSHVPLLHSTSAKPAHRQPRSRSPSCTPPPGATGSEVRPQPGPLPRPHVPIAAPALAHRPFIAPRASPLLMPLASSPPKSPLDAVVEPPVSLSNPSGMVTFLQALRQMQRDQPLQHGASLRTGPPSASFMASDSLAFAPPTSLASATTSVCGVADMLLTPPTKTLAGCC